MSLRVEIDVPDGAGIATVTVSRPLLDHGEWVRYTWECALVDGRTIRGGFRHRPIDGAWVLLERIFREIGALLR